MSKIKLIIKDSARFDRPIPDSSRPQIEGEEKYIYRSKEEILAGIRNKEYIEYGEYGDHLYGTRLKSIQDILAKGKMCILDVNPWLRILNLLKVSFKISFSIICNPFKDFEVFENATVYAIYRAYTVAKLRYGKIQLHNFFLTNRNFGSKSSLHVLFV